MIIATILLLVGCISQQKMSISISAGWLQIAELLWIAELLRINNALFYAYVSTFCKM